MDIRHWSHQHPLVFIQDEGSPASEIEGGGARCLACEESVEGRPSYRCNRGCNFCLHQSCANINSHPLHPGHTLVFLSKSPYYHKNYCNLCRQQFSGPAYHCPFENCKFDLDIDCARLQLAVTGSFHKLKHPCHVHPLIFLNEKHNKKKEGRCEACRKKLSGPIYRCLDSNCSFDLHKKCAEEQELPWEIFDHPLHPEHRHLKLRPQTDPLKQNCFSCRSDFPGFLYQCNVSTCKFQLDVRCALDQLSVAEKYPRFQHSLHEHPLIFIEKHLKTIKGDCFGCRKPLSGPIYKCLHCSNFDLHKECGHLDLELNHPYDRKHTLTLLHNPPSHPVGCSCYLCQIQWKGFVYYCSICKFGLTPEDVRVSSSPEITAEGESETHEHQWILLSRPMSFFCDFCGTECDRTPYLCTTCHRIVHRKCSSLPCSLNITRHEHQLSHSYSLPRNQSEEKKCRICYEEVDTVYGSYCCSESDCNYIAHVNCATHKSIWDGKPGDKSRFKRQSESWITVKREDDGIATRITHAHHKHELILIPSGEDINCTRNCDGCMWPISTPFYGCSSRKCDGFSLHKSCAELPTEKRHPSHKDTLILRKNASECCTACNRFHHGFHYKCNQKSCDGFNLDIGCSSLSDTWKHPSHEHPLFLDPNYQGNCNGCGNQIKVSSLGASLGYKCMKGCPFALDFSCLTLPEKAWYKYDDKHPLSLTYYDGSGPNQCYCDLCEEERDPKHLIYCCADCDNTVHPKCILGEFPLVKLGEKLEISEHRHPLTFVKWTWNCPRCDICRKLCNGQALECKEPECKFIIHWECHHQTSSANKRLPKYFPVKTRREDAFIDGIKVTLSQMAEKPTEAGEGRLS